MNIIDSQDVKILVSEDYSYIFNKKNGLHLRWGRSKDDDPDYSKFGPEILDFEISDICNGVKGIGPCKFCYKSNTKNGSYTNLDTFKAIFDKLPLGVLTQVALGIGDIDSNPDLFPICNYIRGKGIVPNITINGYGMTQDLARTFKDTFGAVSVSVYDKNTSYNAIQMLTEAGMTQVNIHYMICEETYDDAFELLQDRLYDPRLKDMGSIVFLSLKQKGRAVSNYSPLSQAKFNKLVSDALNLQIRIGFDSCSGASFISFVKEYPAYNHFLSAVEPCESTRFSMYLNLKGEFFPCSFIEGEDIGFDNWGTGLSVLECEDFIKDIWLCDKVKRFRSRCIDCNKQNISCPHYKIRG